MMKKLHCILIVAFATMFSACDKSPGELIDSVDDYVSLNNSFSIIDQTLMIEVVDAADGVTIPDNITVSVSGEDSEYVFESGGTRDYQTIDGKLYLAVNPSYNAVEGDDIEFNVLIEAPGYLSVNAEVYISENEPEQLLTVPMINLSATPSGVANTTATFGLTGNGLAGDQQVTVAPGTDKETGAIVTLPDGLQFYDASGNMISGSSVEVSLTHFDANEEEAGITFPGGFMPNKVMNENGVEEEVFFSTAGFASIDMSVAGSDVKSFSNPVSVSMTITDDTYNVVDDVMITAGDVIPIWSYEVATGTWQYEQDATVVEENGELTVNFDITHLSWYNIDYKGARCSYYVNGGVSVIGDGNYSKYAYCELVYASTGQLVSYYAAKSYTLYNGQNIKFYNAPYAYCKFRVYSGTSRYSKGTLVAESASFRPCSDAVSITMPSGYFPVPVTLKGTASCANGSIERPSFHVYYKLPSSTYYSYLGYVYKGEIATTRLDVGQTYDFVTYYNNKVYYETITIAQLNNVVDFPLDNATCNQLFN
ncbi:hypothetical protein NBRC110019_31550 [Neptunitalea chrysea]|uniref:Calx-beta domain-containing protein n=1 Tax=Neptunitalea chrysea TaxID=1647581 RepID=A0A9W6B7C3_9FLAO|nr:hypothetical protein [Neptunitalea chrysea]GLB54114.1 hypothetical protein NBRC110019_31550 [Neptunitalea chrysea]